jgi:hypothetical protein
MIEWLRAEYEVIFEDGTGAMKVRRGKVHDYVGMRMDYTTKGQVHLTMPKHIEDVLATFENSRTKVERGLVEVKKVERRGSRRQIWVTGAS